MLLGVGASRAPRPEVLVLVLLIAACNATPTPTRGPTASLDASLFGGTVRVGVMDLDATEQFSRGDPTFDEWLDPQANLFGVAGLFRCCLLRTLVSHSGLPPAEGGGELIPDLAEALPEISDDATTWTFRLQRGIFYAPPMEDVEITAADFVIALERTLRSRPPNPDPEAFPQIGGYYADFFTIIEGADAYIRDEADSVSGVEVPDDYTIEFTLAETTWDFGDRLALPAMAPIPPGASNGHDAGYGRFLVASGPYMVEGADALDFSLPPGEQEPPSGLGPGGSITLVKNPSWQAATDRLRTAFAERIEFIHQPAVGPLAVNALVGGDVDLLAGPSGDYIEEHLSPLPDGVTVPVAEAAAIFYIPLNLARPPLDDVHVRRAMNLVINRDAVLTAFGRCCRIARHFAPNTLTGGLLTNFDPYGPGETGNLEAAMEEMKQSRYDHDRDGKCDDLVCTDMPAVLYPGFRPAAGVAEDLLAIGIDLTLIPVDAEADVTAYEMYYVHPETYPALWFGIGFGSDYPSPSAWFTSLAHSSHEAFGLIGQSPEELEAWGYEVTSVPNVDDRIEFCQLLVGSAAVQCWAELEQYLLEEIVPWIPLTQFAVGHPVGDRVTHFSIDWVANAPAYDKIVVTGS